MFIHVLASNLGCKFVDSLHSFSWVDITHMPHCRPVMLPKCMWWELKPGPRGCLAIHSWWTYGLRKLPILCGILGYTFIKMCENLVTPQLSWLKWTNYHKLLLGAWVDWRWCNRNKQNFKVYLHGYKLQVSRFVFDNFEVYQFMCSRKDQFYVTNKFPF